MTNYELFGQSLEIEFADQPTDPTVEHFGLHDLDIENCKPIEYLKQLLAHSAGLRRLKRSGSTDQLIEASQISLELSMRSELPETAADHLGVTAMLLEVASTRHFVQKHNDVDSNGAKILVGQAHWPLMRRLILDYRLPYETEAETAYERTIETGLELVRFLDERYKPSIDLDKQGKEMIGYMAELSHWIILARFGLNGPGSEEWFPYFSQHSEDKANIGNRTKINRAWDASVLACMGDEIHMTNRVQVKSSDQAVNNYPIMPEGISLVHVQPDLSLEDDDRPSYISIIKEAAEELTDTTKARPRKRLNKRQDALLEIIG